MTWYGKYEDDDKPSEKQKKKKKDVGLTARYLNSDDDGSTTIHENWEDEEISLTTKRGHDN
jgi:hypothetical protein